MIIGVEYMVGEVGNGLGLKKELIEKDREDSKVDY